MARLLLAAAATIVTLWSSLGFAQAPNEQIGVRLDIICDRCEDIIRSYLSRELRKLPDVVITNDKPTKELRIAMLETVTHRQGSPPVGYAMAYLFVDLALRDSSAAAILLYGGEKSDKQVLALVADQIRNNLVSVGDVRLRVFPASAMEAQCREVIAEFDGSFLEQYRRAAQLAKEMFEEAPKPTPTMPH